MIHLSCFKYLNCLESSNTSFNNIDNNNDVIYGDMLYPFNDFHGFYYLTWYAMDPSIEWRV